MLKAKINAPQQPDNSLANESETVLTPFSQRAEWERHPRFLEYREWLEDKLTTAEGTLHRRFEHSLGVCETAIRLAKGFGYSQEMVEMAMTAALLHDAAKLQTPALLLAWAEDFGLRLDASDLASPQTLHPFIGAELVKNELQIEDVGILDAIRYHTTGRAAMTPLEKIVYIADKCENRTRNADYVAKMTAALDFGNPNSLDVTMLRIIDETLTGLIEKRQFIHPRTLEARNDLVLLLQPPSLMSP